jgi:hypothetical protein
MKSIRLVCASYARGTKNLLSSHKDLRLTVASAILSSSTRGMVLGPWIQLGPSRLRGLRLRLGSGCQSLVQGILWLSPTKINLLKASLSIALDVSSIPWITMTVHCGRPVGFPGLARLYQRLPRLSQLFMIDIQQELLGKLDTGGVKRAPTWHLRALAKVKG